MTRRKAYLRACQREERLECALNKMPPDHAQRLRVARLMRKSWGATDMAIAALPDPSMVIHE